MGSVTVDQIKVTSIKRIKVEGGDVMHAIKNCDPEFNGFGEAYFSLIDFNAIKGWKRHLTMTLNLVVPIGSVQFVFFDDFAGIRKELIGQNNYMRLTVPPGIWFSFKGKESPYSLILNIADIQHDPNEVERKNLNNFLFDWSCV